MTDVYERLRAAGVVLLPCSHPVGSYVPNEIYGRVVFGEAGLRSRTSVGVRSLPGGASVEIELVASLRGEAAIEEER